MDVSRWEVARFLLGDWLSRENRRGGRSVHNAGVWNSSCWAALLLTSVIHISHLSGPEKQTKQNKFIPQITQATVRGFFFPQCRSAFVCLFCAGLKRKEFKVTAVVIASDDGDSTQMLNKYTFCVKERISPLVTLVDELASRWDFANQRQRLPGRRCTWQADLSERNLPAGRQLKCQGCSLSICHVNTGMFLCYISMCIQKHGQNPIFFLECLTW